MQLGQAKREKETPHDALSDVNHENQSSRLIMHAILQYASN